MSNEDPGVCVDVKVWMPELSIAVGSVQFTIAVGNPRSVIWVIFLGILNIIGFDVSIG